MQTSQQLIVVMNCSNNGTCGAGVNSPTLRRWKNMILINVAFCWKTTTTSTLFISANMAQLWH